MNTPAGPSPAERLKHLQELLSAYSSDDVQKRRIAELAVQDVRALEELLNLAQLEESLEGKPDLQKIAKNLRGKMGKLLAEQAENTTGEILETPPVAPKKSPTPESTPPLELNKAYFNETNAEQIGKDLDVFARSRNFTYEKITTYGEHRVDPGNAIEIGGKRVAFKKYIDAAGNALEKNGYPNLRTPKTKRISQSKTLKILIGIASGDIKSPEDVKKPPTRPPEPAPPKPVVPPGPITSPPKPDDKTPPESAPITSPITPSKDETPPPMPVVVQPVTTEETPPAPHPEPSLPAGRQVPVGEENEPTPEATPEAPSFSRFLHKILEDPEQKETILKKLAGENGRLWIDKKIKNPDGSERAVRLWLTVQPKDGQSLEDALKDIPNTLRTRIDDLSTGNSWKEKWNTQKNERARIEAVNLYKQQSDAKEDSAAVTAGNIAAQLGLAGTAKDTFVSLLQQYVAKEGTKEIWTHVRNAYWHADEWKDISELPKELKWTPPTYEKARIREWNKISDADKAKLTDTIKLHRAGLPMGEWSFPSGEANPKNGFYHLMSGTNNLWIREEHLRISYEYNGATPPETTGNFELMAWQVQTDPPATPDGSKPLSKTPPPAGKGPTSPAPKTPPVATPPPAGKKGKTDAIPLASPTLPKPPPKAALPKATKGPDVKESTAPPKPAPKESHESAEILRKQEVIAIPDIHGDADALFDSLKEAGYVKGSRTGKWELEPRAKTERIILTGDLLDRGPQNLETLDLILELKKRGANLEVIAGNHDLFIPEALGEELPELHKPAAKIGALTEWIGNDDDAQVLQEVCKKYFAKDADLPKMINLCERAHTAAYFALESNNDAEFRKILANPTFWKILQKAQEIFVSEKGPYKPIFDNLKIMTDVDDVLYVHAGINDQWIELMLNAAKGEINTQKRREKAVQAANNHFGQLMQKPSSLTRSSWRDIVWIREFQKWLRLHSKGIKGITEEEAQRCSKVIDGLKQLGFRMIVHGHDRDYHAQEVNADNTIDGVMIVNGDVSMSAGYRGSRKAFLRIGKDGVVAARNGTEVLPKLTQLPTTHTRLSGVLPSPQLR